MTPERLAEIKRPVTPGPSASWTLREQKQDLLAEVHRLQKRLKAAEDLCVMFGWTACRDTSDASKAAAQLYIDWVVAVGPDFTGPEAHPDLSVHRLARRYDEQRAATIAKLLDGESS